MMYLQFDHILATILTQFSNYALYGYLTELAILLLNAVASVKSNLYI